MEVDNVAPSEINGLLIDDILGADVIDLNKKRKFQAEHLGLPIAKLRCLKCSDGSFSTKTLSTLDEIPEVDDLQTNVKGGATNDGFEHESADSNIYSEDCDSSMSVHGETKFGSENGKSCSYDRPSSSSLNWASSSFKDPSYTSDITAKTGGGSGKEQSAFVGEEHLASHHHIEGLDEHLNEYGSRTEHLCSGYSHDSTEDFTGKEIEESPYSKEDNQNVFVLSSGRWNVNQETQRGKKKPTIDQEFEQYFSSLML